jgi:hypothetical protein
MARLFCVCCLVLGLSTAWAAGPPPQNAPGNYAGELVAQIRKAHPEVLGATLSAAAPKSSGVVVVASTDPIATGSGADPLDIVALTQGSSSRIDAKAGQIVVHSPLQDVSGDTVGALRLSFAYQPGMNTEAVGRKAAQIREWLHRRVSHAGNLFDPVPYDRDAPAANTYAQQLVDEVMQKHPEIEIFVIHATPPESDYNVIAASNIGRIGKKADNDDMRCIFTGKPNLEVNSTGKRFESEMPLHDRKGQVIGAVGVVVAYKQGDDKQVLFKRADEIRVVLEKQIPDSDSLFRAGAGAGVPAAPSGS